VNKSYWLIILGLLLIVGLDWFIKAPDSRLKQLNEFLQTQASAKLKNYPYKFHVMKVHGDIAFMSTPRNVQVPAFKALGVLYPDIDTKNPNDPAFVAVEQLLGDVQSEARMIVLTQPGIKDVRWQLDRDWLTAHYIEIPQD
jgi:hypothetical protein